MAFAKRRNKYNARKIHYDGYVFDSILEAERYILLQREIEAGTVRYLFRQLPFAFEHDEQLICKYLADFVYDRLVDGEWEPVWEDVKGVRTDIYNLKKRMMLIFYNIEITEFPKPGDKRIPKKELKKILGIEDDKD